MNRKLISVFLAALCCLFLSASCSRKEGVDTLEANILLIWPTDEKDPAYEKWTTTVKEELHRQGINGQLEVHFTRLTKIYEYEERKIFNDLIYELRVKGQMPDLILCYGQQNYWMMATDVNSLAKSVPVVCFGLSSEDFLPYQYDMLENTYKGGKKGIVRVVSRPHLKENLDLADSISTHIIEYIKRPDYYFLTKNRLITMLDVEDLWTDKIIYNQFVDQMAVMDTSLYYSNLEARATEDQLIKYATKQDKLVFSCRSVMKPTWNISEQYNQISTTWSFYPQKSPNILIQSKHDYKSKELVDGPSASMYFTMVPEDYINNAKCVGGYFAPYESQIRDAVSAGVRVLKGETEEEIGVIENKPEYFLNWNVIRPLQLDVNLVPDYVNVDNATLKDRDPKKYHRIEKSIWATFIVLLVWSTLTVFILSRRYRRNNLKLRNYSNEIINNNKTLEQMMNIADIKIWEMVGDELNMERITASEFFMRKIVDFIRIDVPGYYEQRFYCSVDNRTPHWYEIRMTVSLVKDEPSPDEDDTQTESSHIERRGVIMNIDAQKELEAIAAETNRIIQLVRTREGFIASINHQIRTPLNSIVGYSQLLTMPDFLSDEAELQEYRRAIDNNAFLLKQTINNILTSTMLDKSGIVPKFEIVRLNDLIGPDSEVGKAIISKERLELVPGPAELDVRVDANMLQRVIENLLINAVNFSKSSSTVFLGWNECNEEGYVAEIWVQDHGQGIKPEYQDLIFQQFFKADSFTAGCGLGLYVCKSFTELMGGRISVESKPGEGSTFKLKLAC